MPLLLVIITCTLVFDPCCLALPSVFVVLLPSAEQAHPVAVHLLIAKGPCSQPATVSVATPPPLPPLSSPNNQRRTASVCRTEAHHSVAANLWTPKCSIQKQCFLLCKESLGSNSQATRDLFCAYWLHPLKKKERSLPSILCNLCALPRVCLAFGCIC